MRASKTAAYFRYTPIAPLLKKGGVGGWWRQRAHHYKTINGAYVVNETNN